MSIRMRFGEWVGREEKAPGLELSSSPSSSTWQVRGLGEVTVALSFSVLIYKKVDHNNSLAGLVNGFK